MRLTDSQLKAEYFKDDLYYREIITYVNDIIPDKIDLFASQYASILFKPEAVVNRKIKKGLEVLASEGYHPVAYSKVKFNRHVIRAIWRYQFNAASNDRLTLFDLLLTSLDSVYFILKYSGGKLDVNAVCRLNDIKGCSTYPERNKEHLRYKLGLVDEMINYIHVPDEPADMLRELCILFDKKDYQSLIKTSFSNLSLEGLDDFITSVYKANPYHDLSFNNALDRIVSNCEILFDNSNHDKESLSYIIECCNNIKSKKTLHWSELITAIEAANIRVDVWDKIVIISQLSEVSLPDVKALL